MESGAQNNGALGPRGVIPPRHGAGIGPGSDRRVLVSGPDFSGKVLPLGPKGSGEESALERQTGQSRPPQGAQALGTRQP